MQWKPDDDTQVYGFYTRGFRSGGYNTRNNSAVVPPGPTDQEIMDSFELGAKHNFGGGTRLNAAVRSEEHTSELQSLMRISYAVFCLKKKNKNLDRNKHITKETINTTEPQKHTQNK